MSTVKDILIAPISATDANSCVKRFHYSGKVVNNSQLHLGVFLGGQLEGAMQFGPSLDKRKIMGLVAGTGWNEFIELNRMAFSPRLPRNSESRALSVAFRLIRKQYPHLRWCISFADATQSGDGAIYRASGFVLTGIKKNTQIWALPDGFRFTRMVATDTRRPRCGRIISRASMTMKGSNGACAQRRELESAGLLKETGGASMRLLAAAGARPIVGFQLRYIYFLNSSARARLTVPVIPFSEIEKRGARMYLGVRSETGDTATIQVAEGGSTPTLTLQEATG